jgi:cephalosporin hydroxylase
METSEQTCLLAFAQKLRPECVIEVGSRFGGSMQVFSRYAKRVISCDIDPTCRERFGHKYPNAEFVVGPSQQTLPPLLAKLQKENVPVSILLLDGDHSTAGIQADIAALRDYRPTGTLYVFVHDSFNPFQRHGIRTARWDENPYVHSVELDFITGVMHFKKDYQRQMWGGFALAVFKPEPRTAPLVISANSERLFRSLVYRSAHTFPMRAIRKLSRIVGLRR